MAEIARSPTPPRVKTRGARWVRKAAGPVRFREFLERRGPTFVKIGQLLALRPDLIAADYADELMRLFEHGTPVPWPTIRGIIKAEFGSEPADLFGYFDIRPLGAGSLAQTHYARLHDGRAVVVKVLRPGIAARVERDLHHARRLARLLTLSGRSFIVDPVATVDELGRWMAQEIDFTHELGNIQRLRQLAQGDGLQVIPKPYPDYSGPRVLTLQYLDGIHVADLLRPRPADGARNAGDHEIDRDALAARLIEACLTQIFRYRFFHADLHPGNLIARSDGRIGFVDFGLCEQIDDTVREKQMQYLGMIYRGDNEQVFRALLDILVATDDADADGLRRDFLAADRMRSDSDGLGASAAHGEDARSSPIARYLVDVIRAARRNGYQIPTRILSMYRTLLTAELVARQLGSDVDLRSVGRRFIEDLQRDEALRLLDLDQLQPTLLGYLTLWREYPAQLSQLLTDLADNRFVLKVSTADHPDVRHDRNRRARGLITAILSVSVAVLLSSTATAAVAHDWLKWPLLAALVGLYVLTLLQYRKLR